jgi:hypothetical protein
MDKDTKAQSTQLGFIIMLGILVIYAAALQAYFVPVKERAEEIDHNKDLETDFERINTMVKQLTEREQSDSIITSIGHEYDKGFIFLTPFPEIHSLDPQGSLIVNNFINTTIIKYNPGAGGVVKTRSDSKLWWNRVKNNNSVLTNGFISNTVRYSRIRSKTRVYENGMYYDAIRDSSGDYQFIIREEPNLIENHTINLYSVVGEVNVETLTDKRLKFEPISSSDRKPIVKVTSDDVLKLRLLANLMDITVIR